jgi:hypothetical protein
MNLKQSAFATLLSLFSLTVSAQTVVCKTDPGGPQALLIYQPAGPGRAEALAMEYQGKSVLQDPLSLFNHSGIILFRAEGNLEFNALEYSDDFSVTVSVFGGQPVLAARGKCRLKN